MRGHVCRRCWRLQAAEWLLERLAPAKLIFVGADIDDVEINFPRTAFDEHGRPLFRLHTLGNIHIGIPHGIDIATIPVELGDDATLVLGEGDDQIIVRNKPGSTNG